MNYSRLLPNPDESELLSLTGADAVGIAKAEAVDAEAVENYGKWLSEGCHASMSYMERYGEVRNDPRLLLPGAKSIIMLAYSYFTPEKQPEKAPKIALYARGGDYHNVLRKKLSAAVKVLKSRFGGDYRICIDSAPLRERYWAVKSGLGFIGRNSQLIVPGVGSYCFLAAVVTTLELTPSHELSRSICDDCGRCQRACPGGAIMADRCAVDARRCISYLTIEAGRTADSSIPWPENLKRGGRIIGCDECQRVCPHNRNPKEASLPRFMPRSEVMNLTQEALLAMTQEEYDKRFAGSAIRRAPLAHLKKLLNIP